MSLLNAARPASVSNSVPSSKSNFAQFTVGNSKKLTSRVDTGAPSQDQAVGHTDVLAMVAELSIALEAAINEIHAVNGETKVLALNARIEAARAGTLGAAFSVVAEEMQELSEKTSHIAEEMANRTRQKTLALRDLIGSTIRGTRLSDIALTNIDLIDRNLYERTCDVRWWATDKSLVDALTLLTHEACSYASSRMGVILGAYTVYFDLVLCDHDGIIVANANPQAFRSVGKNVGRSAWFASAMATRNGDEFGFQSAHNSELVDGRPSLIYSCAVRENGESSGRPLGALGIVFNWNGLAQTILDNIPVAADAKAATQGYIVNRDHVILASTNGYRVGESLSLPAIEQIFARERGFYSCEIAGKPTCIAFAKAPGFETYSTGWFSIITQTM